jgi:hypothetical protein
VLFSAGRWRANFGLLGASALDEELNAAIIRLFFLRCEIAAGKFAPLAVIVQAFAAQSMFSATCIRAIAVLDVDFRPRALILFAHDATLSS